MHSGEHKKKELKKILMAMMKKKNRNKIINETQQIMVMALFYSPLLSSYYLPIKIALNV